EINDLSFRYVSIITSRNAQRDRINEIQLKRFAEETEQTIHSFYSWDVNGHTKDPATTKRKIYRKSTAVKSMTEQFREVLWNLPPCDTSHLPGILNLCLGMPIMIKNNEATELCITNGQECHVHGWKSSGKRSPDKFG
ncbi:hypothetical protein K435DRAFT_704267, partial [Dendrothele bispora CBS 962.96]